MSSRPKLTRFVQLMVLCIAMITMLGAGNSDASRFQSVGHNMMCSCGCGQILLECNHVSCPSSPVMIEELHNQIAAGGTDKAILTWFATKYGATILAAPMRGGFDDVAWITPIALFLLATLGTALLVRVWRARHPAQAGHPATLAGLNPSQTDELRDRIRKETQY
jgi:cytochrome c-type biogenesis protein CcmH/NrfF